jgi:hypothetical protein
MTEERVTWPMLRKLYNQYLIDLLMLAKKTPSIRHALSEAGHKAISPDAEVHIAHAIASLHEKLEGVDGAGSDPVTRRECLASEPFDALLLVDYTESGAPIPGRCDAALTFEPIKGVSFLRMLEVESKDDLTIVGMYVYILATLATTFNDEDDDLASSVVSVLSRAQSEVPDILQKIDGILEDDIVKLLDQVSTLSHRQHVGGGAPGGDAPPPPEGEECRMDDILNKMKDSKIASIAEEISRDIDPSMLSDLGAGLNFNDLTNASTPLGSIVSKVGSTIQSKMATGEINQADIMKEAFSFLGEFQKSGAMGGGGAGAGGGGAGMPDLFSMMSSMMAGGGGGGMANLAKAAAAMGASGSGSGRSAGGGRIDELNKRRDRIRKKLADKKQSS